MKMILDISGPELLELRRLVDLSQSETLARILSDLTAGWYSDCQVRQHCLPDTRPTTPTPWGMACDDCAVEVYRQIARGADIDQRAEAF